MSISLRGWVKKLGQVVMLTLQFLKGCKSLSKCLQLKVLLNRRVCWSLSRVRLFATPKTVAHQAPLSMEFSRQEYCSGLPFPSPFG